jgi:malonate transporter and related proteins
MIFSVLQIVAPVFVIIAAGYAALRLGYLESAALVGLSAFVVRVALPALVFNALAGAPVGETMDARYLAGYCAGSLAVFAVGYLWARRDGREAGVCAMQGLGMSVSNSGSVGFPIGTLVIGAGAASILAQTMIVENQVMLPIGLTIAEMAGARDGSLAAVLAGIGRTLIRNPLLIAIAAGIAVAASGISLPFVAARPVALVGTAAVPLALFVVGGRLAQLGKGGGAPGEVARIVAGKLAAHPLAVGVALVLMPGLDPVLLAGGLLFAAAPMMSIYAIFGARFGMAELSATALLVATVCACVTLTVLILLLERAGLVSLAS